MFSNPPKIVFHHIPKCGGMSIVAGLGMTYYPMALMLRGRGGFPGLLNARAASEMANFFKEDVYAYRRKILGYYLERDDSNFIPGHYPFCRDLCEHYKDSYRFVTLFRDPVKRWYSEYYWNRYKDHDYGRTELSMEEYLDSEQGRFNTRSYVNFLTHAQNPSAPVDELEKKQAIENLDCFAVIGILENLDRFRSDMKKEFGRKPFFIKRNTSPAPAEAKVIPPEDSEFHQKLLGLLQADIAIYEAVKQKLGL